MARKEGDSYVQGKKKEKKAIRMKSLDQLRKEKELLEAQYKMDEERRKLESEIKDLKYKNSWFGKIKAKTSPKIRSFEQKVFPKLVQGFKNIGKNITEDKKKDKKCTTSTNPEYLESY